MCGKDARSDNGAYENEKQGFPPYSSFNGSNNRPAIRQPPYCLISLGRSDEADLQLPPEAARYPLEGRHERVPAAVLEPAEFGKG